MVSHEVRLRKVQTGPELGWASLAQRAADEEVPLTVNVAFAQVTNRSAAATMKGCNHAVEGGNFEVLISAHCKRGCDRCAKLHHILATPPTSPTLRVGCQRRAPSWAYDATTANKLLRTVVNHTRLLIAPQAGILLATITGL